MCTSQSTAMHMALTHCSFMRTGTCKGQLSVGIYVVSKQPIQVAYFEPIQVWKGKNKIMKRTGKNTREGSCLFYKQGGASFTSELDDTAIKNLFCWWEHHNRHHASAVREVLSDHCCTARSDSAYGSSLGSAHPSSECTPHTSQGSPSAWACPEDMDPTPHLATTIPSCAFTNQYPTDRCWNIIQPLLNLFPAGLAIRPSHT